MDDQTTPQHASAATPAAMQQAYAAALQHHRAGRLQQAEALYRQALSANPNQADGLHMLGVIASQTGRHGLAAALIGKAVTLVPRNAMFRTNLGNVLVQQGRLEEAIACYRRAVRLDPKFAPAHDRLGHALHRQGRLNDAAASFRRAILLTPDDANLHLSLGNLLYQQDRLDEAASCYRIASGLAPRDPAPHSNLGGVLYRQRRLEAAAASCRDALTLDPDCEAAHANLADALREMGDHEAAAASYRRAIALKPHRAEMHNNLGTALLLLDQPAEAAACFQAASRLKPDFVEPHVNLAVAHARLGQPAETIAASRAALHLAPLDAEAHNNLAMALLTTGDWASGWPEYEWRWQVEPGLSAQRSFPRPQWRGEPAEGRTLLIHAEQGFGDTLQFCRYAPLVRARGLRAVIEAPAPLVRLLHGLAGVDAVVAAGAPLPEFDLHCPMLSLPLALRTTPETVPQTIPYLAADTAQARSWRMRLMAHDRDGPRIGLAWAGSRRALPLAAEIDRRRSIPPDRLAPLFDVPGLQWFSLQKDGPAAPATFPLTDPMAAMQDFADTAALIANLDLVISVDTAVAHLAGALGRPVWLLDRFDHCWRWLAGQRESPWYPALRCYRQPERGDWDSVVAELAGDLRSLSEAWRAAWDAAHGVPRDA